LFPILQAANVSNAQSLMIVVRSLSEKAIALLTAHNKMDKFKVAAVKLPGLNADDRMAVVDDLSRLTGANPYLTVVGNRLESMTASDFGTARRLWADMRSFGLVGGGGNPAKLREHIRILKARYHNLPDKDDRKKLQERIGNLLGGAITVYVGGFTEPDITNRKSIADRTALALRSAIQEGVVPGGGIALLNCRQMLQQQRAYITDTDHRAAYNILFEAFDAPARSIFQNAGYDSSEVMAQLYHECADMGFDVIGNRVVNMREAGILDSATTLKASVRNAISTAAMALTIDSLVHLSNPEMIGKPT
jgi:chaperonin GroEL